MDKLNKIYREMEYKYEPDAIKRPREVLADGEIGDYQYIILSHGIYPAVYIRLPLTSYYGRRAYYDNVILTLAALRQDVRVHGGIQYVSKRLDIGHDMELETVGLFVGWTYNLDDDYIAGFENHINGHSWTTRELVCEATEAIYQLREMDGCYGDTVAKAAGQ